MRNDLGRVCEYGSIVGAARPAPSPPGLWHLVSRVRGELRHRGRHGELVRATFRPASVTGAPKVQAMKVIAELELAGREVYTGAIGFASPAAGLELSVAIRTLELGHGRLWLGAGGGIVSRLRPRQGARGGRWPRRARSPRPAGHRSWLARTPPGGARARGMSPERADTPDRALGVFERADAPDPALGRVRDAAGARRPGAGAERPPAGDSLPRSRSCTGSSSPRTCLQSSAADREPGGRAPLRGRPPS